MSAPHQRGDALELADRTVIWFAVLQGARRCGDARLAGRSLSELERLGVRVLFAADALHRKPVRARPLTSS
jgi:hypothetical protein